MKTIGIIALSGDVNRGKISNAKAYLEFQGFGVKLSDNIFDKDRYLAGSDEVKLKALKSFFKDPEIDIIMCARGGYGAIRLVNIIDYEIIKNNPKIFTGFSDVTALLLMIYKKTGLITYHGVMAQSDFGENPANGGLPAAPILQSGSFTEQNFFRAISGEKLEFEGTKVYKNGSQGGIIWGGNLATVVSLCGLDFIPDEDFVFFTEDLNEPVYKIDKMFQQLVNIDKFREHCKGIVLGDFLDCGNDEWLEDYFNELAGRLNVPVAGGFKITHNKDKITIPIGKKCSMQGRRLIIG